MDISKRQIAHLRMLKSGIIAPFSGIEECVSRLFGIQSQAQQFGEISLLNRVNAFDYDELTELYQRHKIIKIWGQRMTVHMFSAKDWKIVHQVYGKRDNFAKKMWQEHGTLLDTLLSTIDRSVGSEKVDKATLTNLIDELAPNVDSPYRDYSVILQASLNGLIFGIPKSPQTLYFAHRKACIDEEEYRCWQDNRQSAFDYLLLNYFQNYGPASLADFCHWSGLRKTEVQPVLERNKEKLTDFSHEGQTLYLLCDDELKLGESEPANFVKLLGKFDPLFVSFADKSWITTLPQQKAIWRPAGHVEAVLLVNERLTGTWRYAIKGKKVDFTFYLFNAVDQKTKRLISREAERIAAFLGKALNKINYETY